MIKSASDPSSCTTGISFQLNEEYDMKWRKPIIAGNWKMYKTAAETRAFVSEFTKMLSNRTLKCEVVLAPPFTSIHSAVTGTAGTSIGIAGQNLHWEDHGAFTGEVSGPMLKEAGCSHVIIGHSERRQLFGDTDETINLKIDAALRNDLIPIFCLGETLQEREAGITFEVVSRQLTVGLGAISISYAESFIIAYEPVWAIGTGKTASPEQAQEIHAFLRNELRLLRGSEFSDSVRILYGGSVKPDNVSSLMNCEDIDGGLVGGASLKASDFYGIIIEGTEKD
jgi:triosephosphate isomerase